MSGNSPTDVLDRYFSLSNTAGQHPQDFEELVGLFAPDATLVSGRGESATGAEAIRSFFHTFFARNTELHHVWNSRSTDATRVVVEWAVAGRHADGQVFAITGTDTATVDANGRITSLQVAAK
ncbi:nuclear transport factor 2 family protein [Pseudoclavibacter sp. CFCC 11306]|uniref:nuclear transport factor 2 family protein n=1 Tax=Pseudoclavibacter sp. CFCC 11306 TaxID=1564493 RepID=UPI00178802C5|nr:nuclear transport factor 2 family protein [Pseudoclavibacter sp. CFCC 11306]